MNEPLYPNAASEVPWPTSGQRTRVPDASMLPGSEVAPPPSDASPGARGALDRFAEGAMPAADRAGEHLSAADDALRSNANALRATKDEWVEGVRTTVRSNPLASAAAAAALGAVIASIAR